MHPMWHEIDRRLLIKLGTAGLAALSLPGAAAAALAQGFTHGVASGEPGANSVLPRAAHSTLGVSDCAGTAAAEPGAPGFAAVAALLAACSPHPARNNGTNKYHRSP